MSTLKRRFLQGGGDLHKEYVPNPPGQPASAAAPTHEQPEPVYIPEPAASPYQPSPGYAPKPPPIPDQPSPEYVSDPPAMSGEPSPSLSYEPASPPIPEYSSESATIDFSIPPITFDDNGDIDLPSIGINISEGPDHSPIWSGYIPPIDIPNPDCQGEGGNICSRKDRPVPAMLRDFMKHIGCVDPTTHQLYCSYPPCDLNNIKMVCVLPEDSIQVPPSPFRRRLLCDETNHTEGFHHWHHHRYAHKMPQNLQRMLSSDTSGGNPLMMASKLQMGALFLTMFVLVRDMSPIMKTMFATTVMALFMLASM